MSGRVVAVAGAGGALGPHVVRLLEEAGDAVSAPGRDEVDLLDPAAAERWAASLERVDALVHLVGGWRAGSDAATWADLHDLLVRTLQHTTRAFLPGLQASEGRVVVVSSPQAASPTWENVAYGTAKAAAEAWTIGLSGVVTANILRVKVISEKNAPAVARGVGFLLDAPMNGQVLPLHKP